MPPEDYIQDTTSSRSCPPNATFAATGLDGTGSVKFDVWTDEENASLGCSLDRRCTTGDHPDHGPELRPVRT